MKVAEDYVLGYQKSKSTKTIKMHCKEIKSSELRELFKNSWPETQLFDLER